MLELRDEYGICACLLFGPSSSIVNSFGIKRLALYFCPLAH
jgi:hypothetical protein